MLSIRLRSSCLFQQACLHFQSSMPKNTENTVLGIVICILCKLGTGSIWHSFIDGLWDFSHVLLVQWFIFEHIRLSNWVHIQQPIVVPCHAKLLHLCPTLCNTMDCRPSGSSDHGIFQTEYWSGVPCPTPAGLPEPGIEPLSLMPPALSGRLFITRASWEAL